MEPLSLVLFACVALGALWVAASLWWKPRLRAQRRARAADAICSLLTVDARESLSDRDEIRGHTGGRTYRVTLYAFGVRVHVALAHPVLPPGLCVVETSAYGPQKQEAWMSGEAVQTGDLEFDLAFNVCAADPATPPDADAGRRIAPAVRSTLLAHRARMRDGEVTEGGVVLGDDALERAGRRPPTREDVQELMARGSEIAQVLEEAT